MHNGGQEDMVTFHPCARDDKGVRVLIGIVVGDGYGICEGAGRRGVKGDVEGGGGTADNRAG